MASLLEELKRRNVFRVAVGYLVLAWVVLQIADLVAPALRLPEWTLSFVTFIGIIGFPFALFFAWAFELTPEGIKRSEDVDPQESITGETAGSLNRIIIGLLCVAVFILLADRFFGLSHRFTGEAVPQVAAVPETREPPGPEVDAELERPRSIAVLPFVNMSGDSEQEYFSDGISEELLNALAQIQELRVAARTSSFAFKGQNQDITQIGEQLKVETVLEGSVRKSGKRVRITAQLINVDDGYHLWSNTYDRDLTDIFAVQDEISAAIVDALKVHLTGESTNAPTREVNIEAYNFLLQARHNQRQRTQPALETAATQYRRALEIDPDYAQAWAGLAIVTLLLEEGGYGDIPIPEARENGQGYLDRAFALAPDLWEAHAGQALLYMNEARWQDGLAAVERALAKNPSEGFLYLWKSLQLDALNEYRLSTETIEKAYSIDPLHPSIQNLWSDRLIDQGRFDEARRMVTPGTRSYYVVETFIAQKQGRWADMITLSEEGAAALPGVRTEFRRVLGFFWAFFLYDIDRALEYAIPHHQDTINATFNPKPILDRLLVPGADGLSDPDLEALVLALITQNRCAEAVPPMARFGIEDMQATPLPEGGHSVGNFAAMLGWCLHELGETDRAHKVASAQLATLDARIKNGGPRDDYVFQRVLARQILGKTSAALDDLDLAVQGNEIPYMVHHWGETLQRSFAGNERYAQIKARHLARLNEERGKLGLKPVQD